jgi:hypothetical protein
MPILMIVIYKPFQAGVNYVNYGILKVDENVKLHLLLLE